MLSPARQSLYTAKGIPCKYRLVLIGDTNVGKSSLMQAQIHKKFNPHPEPTIGAAFGFICRDFPLMGISLSVEMWDSAGQERYRAYTMNYLRNAHVVLIVYDLSSLASLESIAVNWIPYLERHSELLAPDCIKILVGNKSDLHLGLPAKEQQIIQREGRELALTNNLLYAEVSSLTRVGLDDLFDDIFDKLCQKASRGCGGEDRNVIKLTEQGTKKSCSASEQMKKCSS